MKRFIFPLLLLMAFSIFSCKDDESITTTDLTINFTPQYNDDAMSFSNNYEYDSKKIRFNVFDMFISDLTLITNDNQPVSLSEIDWLDFSNADFNNGYVIPRVYSDVNTGDYKAIRFGIGVKPNLNAKKPADFTPDQPLGNSGTYWTGWQSYIFMRIQGDYDNLNDNTYATDLTYHVGSDATYREITIEKPLTINENGSISINFDIYDMFMMNGQPYDITTNNQTPHGPGDIVIASTIMDNIGNAISINQ